MIKGFKSKEEILAKPHPKPEPFVGPLPHKHTIGIADDGSGHWWLEENEPLSDYDKDHAYFFTYCPDCGALLPEQEES